MRVIMTAQYGRAFSPGIRANADVVLVDARTAAHRRSEQRAEEWEVWFGHIPHPTFAEIVDRLADEPHRFVGLVCGEAALARTPLARMPPLHAPARLPPANPPARDSGAVGARVAPPRRRSR